MNTRLPMFDKFILPASPCQELLERHQILRSHFKLDPMGVASVVVPHMSEFQFEHKVMDMERAGAGEAMAALQAAAEFCFDLLTGPLIQFTTICTGKETHLVMANMHHAITDGWSMIILLEELSVVYKALKSSTVVALTPLPVQYFDYAVRWLMMLFRKR